MIKKIMLNVLMILLFYFIPLFYFGTKQNDSRVIDSIQTPIFLIIFLGSAILACLNNFFRKHTADKKWVWIIFEIIGFAGLIYSAGVLCLLYEFRHGIGF